MFPDTNYNKKTLPELGIASTMSKNSPSFWQCSCIALHHFPLKPGFSNEPESPHMLDGVSYLPSSAWCIMGNTEARCNAGDSVFI